MTRVDCPYAGMILPDIQDLDPAPYLDSAAAVLARLGRGRRGGVVRGAHAVFGATLGVQITAEEFSDYGPRVLIEIITPDGTAPDEDQNEAASQLLSETVLSCLDHSQADILEWYAPDVLLDREDFIRLRSYVSPRRARDTSAFGNGHTVDDHLAQTIPASLYADGVNPDDDRPEVTDRLAQYKIEMAAPAPEERRMSIAAKFMTGALKIFSWPAAFIAGILNGGRGLDFRLVSQALAVTSLFTALYHTDRLSVLLHTLLN